MTYTAKLAERALGQIRGFPSDAFDLLVQIMADVCENPYDPLVTMMTEDPQVRRADFGEYGFVTFLIVDSTQLVVVTDILWAG